MQESLDPTRSREKIHLLLSRAYVQLRDFSSAVGSLDLAATSFRMIESQFSNDADEATVLSYGKLKDESRRYLKKLIGDQEKAARDGNGQQLTFEGHLFQFLPPAFMVERNGDSYAVAISDMTLDEWKAVISRTEAEAETLAAQADEARTYVRLKFHVDVSPTWDADESAVYEASAP